MSETLVNVAVNVAARSLFTYKTPASIPHLKPGTRVVVPFGARTLVGVVMGPAPALNLARVAIKPIIQSLDVEPILDQPLLDLCQWIAGYYCHSIGATVFQALPQPLKKGQPLPDRVYPHYTLAKPVSAKPGTSLRRLLALFQDHEYTLSWQQLEQHMPGRWQKPMRWLLEQKEALPASALPSPSATRAAIAAPQTLSHEQQQAVHTLAAQPDGFCCWLLQGVTGSGKTQVYSELIRRQIAQKRQTLILTPEIGLTPALYTRLCAQLDIQACALHSDVPSTQRLRLWHAARAGVADVVVGTRLSVLTPMPRLGLIIVDEEHDASYKQMERLRYHARDVAIMRARNLGIPIVLGSATPSMESLANVKRKRYRHLSLNERYGRGGLPRTHLIDLNQEIVSDGLSERLLSVLESNLQRGLQSMIFVNRRGFSPLLRCQECGWQMRCERCSANLVFHQVTQRLHCHHCHSSHDAPSRCLSCSHGKLLLLGVGSQRIEAALQQRFADARIARIDSDNKTHFAEVMQQAQNGDIQLLIGTQMLSKGHDLPFLNLVAIVDVDQGLFAADFRSRERLIQLLVQVAGRAGRRQQTGDVYIQTRYPDSSWWSALHTGGLVKLQQAILDERESARWPPYSYLALLHAESTQPQAALDFLNRASKSAKSLNAPQAVQIFPPIASPMEKRLDHYRFQLLLRASSRPHLGRLLQAWIPKLQKLPQAGHLRWSIDVDPVDLY